MSSVETIVSGVWADITSILKLTLRSKTDIIAAKSIGVLFDRFIVFLLIFMRPTLYVWGILSSFGEGIFIILSIPLK